MRFTLLLVNLEERSYHMRISSSKTPLDTRQFAGGRKVARYEARLIGHLLVLLPN